MNTKVGAPRPRSRPNRLARVEADAVGLLVASAADASGADLAVAIEQCKDLATIRGTTFRWHTQRASVCNQPIDELIGLYR